MQVMCFSDELFHLVSNRSCLIRYTNRYVFVETITSSFPIPLQWHLALVALVSVSL